MAAVNIGVLLLFVGFTWDFFHMFGRVSVLQAGWLLEYLWSGQVRLVFARGAWVG
jgi:hypothetical protein